MVDFTDTGISPIQEQLPLFQGLPSSTIDTSSYGQQATLAGLGGLVEAGSTIFNAFRQAESDKNLASFTESQLRLADAVDQGRMSNDEARMRMRQNFSAALRENPSFSAQLIDTHKTLISTSGLAKVIDTGTEQEQLRDALYSKAVNNGFADGTEVGAARDEAIELQNKLDRDTTNAQADLQAMQLAAGKTEAEQAAASNRAFSSLQQFAHTNLVATSNQVDKLINSGANSEQLLNHIAQLRAQTQITAGSIEGVQFVKQDLREMLVDPVLSMFDRMEQVVKGETNATTIKNKLNAIMDTTKIAVLQSDSEMANLIAVADLSGQAGAVFGPEISGRAQIVLDMLSSKGISSPSTIPQAEVSQAVDDTLSLLNKKDSGAFDTPEGRNYTSEEDIDEAINNSINNSLKAVSDLSLADSDPKKFKDFVRMFGAESFYNSLKNSEASPKMINRAVDIIQAEFVNQLIPSIKDRFTQDKIVKFEGLEGGEESIALPNIQSKPTSTQIGVDWNGNMIVFRATGNSPEVTGKVRELNGSLAKNLTNMIRAVSHLEGNQDYAKQWEIMQENLFPQPKEEDK